MAIVKIDSRQINGLISAAWKDTAQELDGAFRQAITSPLYEWPRPTPRSNGQIAGSPRDIVDRGELRDSQKNSIRDFEGNWVWNAPHSIIVHEGATLRSGTVLPPRRWTRKACFELYPLEPNYAKNLRKRL
jgi:hypothetical protein